MELSDNEHRDHEEQECRRKPCKTESDAVRRVPFILNTLVQGIISNTCFAKWMLRLSLRNAERRCHLEPVGSGCRNYQAGTAKDLSALDLPVVQIDGFHPAEGMVLLAATGNDGEGARYALGLMGLATDG